MATVMIRVHPQFKTMLLNTQKYIRMISDKEISMEELTKILAVNTNGGSGIMALKFPVILLPEKRVKFKNNNSIWKKYINIVVEDIPR